MHGITGSGLESSRTRNFIRYCDSSTSVHVVHSHSAQLFVFPQAEDQTHLTFTDTHHICIEVTYPLLIGE